MKEESEKASVKLNIQKPKIMASSPITSWLIDGETVDTVTDFNFWGSQITADVDCSLNNCNSKPYAIVAYLGAACPGPQQFVLSLESWQSFIHIDYHPSFSLFLPFPPPFPFQCVSCYTSLSNNVYSLAFLVHSWNC